MNFDFLARTECVYVGKTTLLHILSGRFVSKVGDPVRISGDVFFNDTRLPVHHVAASPLSSFVAFVPHDTPLVPHLTVLETLREAAALQLPSDWTAEKKDRRVAETLQELELTRVGAYYCSLSRSSLSSLCLVFRKNSLCLPVCLAIHVASLCFLFPGICGRRVPRLHLCAHVH